MLLNEVYLLSASAAVNEKGDNQPISTQHSFKNLLPKCFLLLSVCFERSDVANMAPPLVLLRWLLDRLSSRLICGRRDARHVVCLCHNRLRGGLKNVADGLHVLHVS